MILLLQSPPRLPDHINLLPLITIRVHFNYATMTPSHVSYSEWFGALESRQLIEMGTNLSKWGFGIGILPFELFQCVFYSLGISYDFSSHYNQVNKFPQNNQLKNSHIHYSIIFGTQSNFNLTLHSLVYSNHISQLVLGFLCYLANTRFEPQQTVIAFNYIWPTIK